MGVCLVLLELLLTLLSVDIFLTFNKGGGVGLGCDSVSKKRTNASDRDCCDSEELLATCGCKMADIHDPAFGLCEISLSLSWGVKSKTVAIIFRICCWSLFRLLLELIKPTTKFFIRNLSTVAFVLFDNILYLSSDLQS